MYIYIWGKCNITSFYCCLYVVRSEKKRRVFAGGSSNSFTKSGNILFSKFGFFEFLNILTS